MDIAHSATADHTDARHRFDYGGCDIEWADGPTNMARDLALLAGGEAAVRVYRWTEPWVTLGAFQTSDDLLPECPVPSIVRPTAGRAVLHGHDLTLALAAPLFHLGVDHPRRLRAIYRAMVRPILASFSAAGVEACLGEALGSVQMGGSTDCFAGAAGNDVVDRATGQKICGCALRVYQSAALMQCSIPIEAPWVDPNLVFAIPSAPHWIALDVSKFCDALRGEMKIPAQTSRDS